MQLIGKRHPTPPAGRCMPRMARDAGVGAYGRARGLRVSDNSCTAGASSSRRTASSVPSATPSSLRIVVHQGGSWRGVAASCCGSAAWCLRCRLSQRSLRNRSSVQLHRFLTSIASGIQEHDISGYPTVKTCEVPEDRPSGTVECTPLENHYNLQTGIILDLWAKGFATGARAGRSAAVAAGVAAAGEDDNMGEDGFDFSVKKTKAHMKRIRKSSDRMIVSFRLILPPRDDNAAE